jgi:hypothetical protein
MTTDLIEIKKITTDSLFNKTDMDSILDEIRRKATDFEPDTQTATGKIGRAHV